MVGYDPRRTRWCRYRRAGEFFFLFLQSVHDCVDFQICLQNVESVICDFRFFQLASEFGSKKSGMLTHARSKPSIERLDVIGCREARTKYCDVNKSYESMQYRFIFAQRSVSRFTFSRFALFLLRYCCSRNTLFFGRHQEKSTNNPSHRLIYKSKY
jgi:hypothetical protein